ncbi:MAG: FG-GAP repeat protein [Acidobacteria bacterium]|nr:FG-GAP repeat protein [Acidobacteriota bacterium]
MRRFAIACLFALLVPLPALAEPPLPDLAGASEYLVASDGGRGLQAPNRAQGFRTYFEAGGIRVVPRVAGEPGWSWTLALRGLGRTGAVAPVAPARVHAEGARVEYARGALTEWFVNGPDGLEHGFTLRERPAGEGAEVVVDLALGGTLHPRLSPDGQAIDFAAQGGGFVLRYASLAVTDAAGRVLPSRMAGLALGDGTGVGLIFDDRDAVYPVTVDPLATTASWSGESNQVSGWFGYAVATAGDVNGDGYSDAIVGAPAFDNGQGDEGRAFVFLGGASGLAATAAWTAERDQSNALFASSVAAAGDVNGDGYDDVIVGASAWSNGEFYEGAAFLYLGSPAGLQASPAWQVEANQVFAQLGCSVAGAGDVNADGFADVIVGANGYDSNKGAAFLYHGGPAGLSTTVARVLQPTSTSSQFGVSVATAGDVNADGFADVIVGANFHSNPSFNEGAAFVYLGSPAGVAAAPAWTGEANSPGAAFGTSVSTAGDVDGDGYADVLVGAPEFDNGQSNEGRVFLYYGNAAANLNARAPWTFEIDEADAYLGQSVAAAGDVNGDGRPDFAVGAPRSNYGAENAGRAYVFLGTPGGVAAAPGWEFGIGPGSQSFGEFGAAVATAGDVNGDGFSDVLVGGYKYDNPEWDEGRAWVYLGSASKPDPAGEVILPTWTSSNIDVFGQSVASGDMDGDGRPDLIIGAPNFSDPLLNAGRVCVYFGGPRPTWCATGDDAGGSLGASVENAGDVNGDGYDDLIAGAHLYDDSDGRAFVWWGGPDGLPDTPGWDFSLPGAAALVGSSVAGAGDVNGDGFGDVIVGARSFGHPEPEEGGAFVFLGSPAGLQREPFATIEADQPGALLGSVAGAGDVNGDGFSDVIVGAEKFANVEAAEGRAFVYLGGPTALTPSWTAEPNAVDARFGRTVAGAGDVNGDGHADVAVGAPWFTAATSRVGRVYIYHGSATGLAPAPATILQGSSFQFGGAVASAGDVDADGYSDLAVQVTSAYPSEIALYRGSAAGIVPQKYWSRVEVPGEGLLGLDFAVTDVDNDGFTDVVSGTGFERVLVFRGNAESGGPPRRAHFSRQLRVAAPGPLALRDESDSATEFRLSIAGGTPAGRGRVRLEWEAQPAAAPSSGAALGRGAVVRTPAPPARDAALFETVTSPFAGVPLRWRARIASTDPLFPHTTWFSVPARSIGEAKLRLASCFDADGDGHGPGYDGFCAQADDCNDLDASAWTAPGEVRDVRFASRSELTWSPPFDAGSSAAPSYDTLRAADPRDFTSALCLESNGSDTSSAVPEVPDPGATFSYLVRARGACPAAGTLGHDSDGAERSGTACP